MKKTAIFLALVFCFSILTFTGCDGCSGSSTADDSNGTSANEKTVELTVWGAADDQQMLREMAEEFMSQNPEKSFKIEVRVNGENTARDEALKDIDAAADVFAIANDQLGALVNADAIYENTKYAELVRETAAESAIKAATINGKLYGYPSSSETYFLFYDKSKLSEDDVKSLESILQKKQENGTTGFAMDFGDAYFTSLFFLTAGCKLYGEDGQDPSTADYDSEAGIAAAKYIASLKSLGAEDIGADVAGSRFKDGKLAAYISGSWKTDAFSEALGDNLGVAKLPTVTIAGETRNMVSFAGGKMYVVNATTEHPLEAMELAAFLTNEDNQLKRFNDRGLLPCNIDLADHEDIKSHPAIAAELSQLEYSIATPTISQISKYWEPVGAFTKDAFNGKIAENEYKDKLKQLVSDITA